MQNAKRTDKKRPSGSDAVDVFVTYTAGSAPAVQPSEAHVNRRGKLIFHAPADATLVVISQYHHKGRKSADHCAFSSAGSAFIVPRGRAVPCDVKDNGAVLDKGYKYTVVAVPVSGAKVGVVDPIIIIH